MLFFHCASEEAFTALRRNGLPAGERLWTSFDAARRACTAHILVVDPLRFDPVLYRAGGERVQAGSVPPAAFQNLDPYLPAQSVTAAGGYLVRPALPDPEVLLIYRRGVWDLPKGKQDAGEAVETCALREVQEEVGIHDVHLLRGLGTTVHGYEREGAYHVKTTYWYLMRTPETDFTPQAAEGIEAVAWMPWPVAVRHIGYETLRRHMQAVEGTVRAELRV